MHRICLTMGLVACGGGLGTGPLSQTPTAPGVPVAAIQVELVSAMPLPAGTRFDVWATRSTEPEATARLGAGDAVLLRVEPGSWEVWATASWTLTEDSGVPSQTLQCAGRAKDVSVSGRGTTVLKLETVCHRLEHAASLR